MAIRLPTAEEIETAKRTRCFGCAGVLCAYMQKDHYPEEGQTASGPIIVVNGRLKVRCVKKSPTDLGVEIDIAANVGCVDFKSSGILLAS